MIKVSVLAFSLYISMIDIRDHRIYNRDLLIFALPLAIGSRQSSAREVVFYISISLLITILLRVGGGDFKLISLLLIAQGEVVANTRYLQYFLLVLSGSLAITTVYRRSLRGAIALAPSILLPFTVIYLDI